MITNQQDEALDRFIAACDGAASDDLLRDTFTTFRLTAREPQGADPFGQTYRDRQLELYRAIARKPYDVANEATAFDAAGALTRPFPYSTGSCRTAGDHLVTLGRFLASLTLPPGARILEFGPGWGNLTLALAALGHHVTAVDVEPRFCDLIAARAARLGLPVEVVNADFAWAAGVREPFDAVVFFEAFHHAADHLSLLTDLHAAVKRDGRVYLGAEPITADFPSPWGLRLDGQSLWAIRKFGWMELGFRDDYFAVALARKGWRGVRLPVADPAIWELRREVLPIGFDAADPRLATLTGARREGDIALEAAPAGAALFGPHVALSPGRYRGRIRFRDGSTLRGSGQVDVCAENASRVLAHETVEMAEPGRPIEIGFEVDAPTWGVELRFFNDEGFTGRIARTEIVTAAP